MDVIFKSGSWEPIVTKSSDGSLICKMPIACGHFDKWFQFEITDKNLDVLRVDEERRYFLYAIMHAKYQPYPVSMVLLNDDNFDLILHGAKGDVENALTAADRLSNGSVSNLIRIYMKRDLKPMRNGHWFV